MKENPRLNVSVLKLWLQKILEQHFAEWKISQKDFTLKTKNVTDLDDDMLKNFFEILTNLEKLSDPAIPSKEKRKIQQKMR